MPTGLQSTLYFLIKYAFLSIKAKSKNSKKAKSPSLSHTTRKEYPLIHKAFRRSSLCSGNCERLKCRSLHFSTFSLAWNFLLSTKELSCVLVYVFKE